MCSGLSLIRRSVPDQLIADCGLENRIVTRGEGADQEVQFLYRHPKALLPVLHGNQLSVMEWGNRDDKASRLPRTGWCRRESLEEGRWRWLSPEPVEIPANYGLEKGVWFQVKQGMRGILVHDEAERPHVYMLTEPASHYYQVMTRHDRMPVLVDERI